MGELQKRIYQILAKKQGLMGYPTIRNLFETEMNKIIEEMRKEFPDPTEITQAFTMVSNLFPESHGFSKRHLEKFLRNLKEATVKWLK